MKDVENWFEAFVRIGHDRMIFLSSVGSIEEFLYLPVIMMETGNADQMLLLVFARPEESTDIFLCAERICS